VTAQPTGPDFAGLCGSCEHWRAPSERDGYQSALHVVPRGGYSGRTQEEFAQAREVKDRVDRCFGECRAIELTEVEVGSHVPLAVVRDGSDYMAVLYTQETFGCAMYEARVQP